MVAAKPVKKAAPRRVPPAKFVPPSEPNSQNINDWQDEQPVGSLVDGVESVVPDEEEGSRLVERAPRIPSPVVSKARAFADRVKEAAPARKTASKSRGPRVPIDKFIGHAWQMLAQVIQPVNLPVARVLAVQAPVAGMVLEGVIKDTIVDRILQPIARVEAGGEIAFAIMGPPVLVGVLSVKPHLAPVLVPLLRESLRSWIDIAGPQMEKVAKQEQDFEDKYGQRIDDMIEFFMTPPPEAPKE